MAKELSMVENNEKGSKARKYFIEVEKKSRTNVLDFTDPKTVLQLAQNWADEQNKRIEAEKRIKLLEPKARLMQQKKCFEFLNLLINFLLFIMPALTSNDVLPIFK